nr:PREDICTED: receptor-type tyrosine-protein phosphatase R-like [Latimeria chalumnae]|eukprot:XP_006013571.1 PREDICTED: receptor-type tyrosine-protein phosphatase R-like [Latimeria chalumnae]
MQRRPGLLLALSLLQLQLAGCFSGDKDHYLAVHRSRNGEPVFFYHQDMDESPDIASLKMHKSYFHSPSLARISKLHPAMIIKSTYPRASRDRSLNFLVRTEQDLEIENLHVPAADLIIVTLQMDVSKLNLTLLRIFRDGVAAALGLLPQQVHINRLNGRKNCIELFVSSVNDKPDMADPLPPEEVMRSLNINVLHQSLSQFGITEVSPEKNVLQGEHEKGRVWSQEGFYTVVLFLTIFAIVATCLMVLYRLKEKLQFTARRDKEQSREICLHPVPVQTPQTEVKTAGSMVQPQSTPKTVTVSLDSQNHSVAEIKPCLSASPSPFKMRPVGLQER